MKLEDIKALNELEKEFNYPMDDILERAWEPEVGKYYEFSDDQNFCEDSSEIKKLYQVRDIDSLEISKYIDMDRYIDDTGESWRFIRPVEGEFGK